MTDLEKIRRILEAARQAAIEYCDLTGKPLGITGELGEYLAAKTLGLELAEARSPGYDATDTTERRIQIKTRRIATGKRPLSGMVGSIRLEHAWDTVLLVLLDERFELTAIYEAERAPLEAALLRPGSRARNERGSLAISKFVAIGRKVWPEG